MKNRKSPTIISLVLASLAISAPATAASALPETPTAGSVVAAASCGFPAFKVTGAANLRAKPAQNSTVKAKVPRGACVSGVGDATSTDSSGRLWWKVSYQGKTGWMAGSNLRFLGGD